MNKIDLHRAAVKWANDSVWYRFRKHGPYTPGTDEHAYWLAQYDSFIFNHKDL